VVFTAMLGISSFFFVNLLATFKEVQTLERHDAGYVHRDPFAVKHEAGNGELRNRQRHGNRWFGLCHDVRLAHLQSRTNHEVAHHRR
jgi:hypothetical protein